MTRWLAAILLAVSFVTASASAAADAPPPQLFLEGIPQESGLAVLLRKESARAHAEFGSWFGVALDRPVTLHWIVDGKEMEARTGIVAGQIAGAARADRNEIILFAPALVSRPERIVPVLRHEMCHLMFARAAARAEVEPPRWLDEGIAMWRSGEWDLDLAVRRDRAAWLRDASVAGQLFEFEALDSRFPSGALLPLAYAQSASFVEWMAREYGEDALRDFLKALGRDVDLDDAMVASFGEGAAALEAAWREDIAPRGPFGWVPSEGVLMTAVWGVLALLLVVAFIRKRRRFHRFPDDDEPQPSGPPAPPEGSSSQNLASTREEPRG